MNSANNDDSVKKTENDSKNSKKDEVITLEKLANVLVENDLSEIEFEENGKRIYLARKTNTDAINAQTQLVWQNSRPDNFRQDIPENVGNARNIGQTEPGSSSNKASQTDETEVPKEKDYKNHPGSVKSPMVGTAYTLPEPSAEPFVRVGDNVNMGQTLVIIEAMKVLNPIKAAKSGKVVAIMVHNQKPVEYDEILLIIE